MKWASVSFDPARGYPVSGDLHYECLGCQQRVPSLPHDSVGCTCGNLFIDVDAGRVSVKDVSKVVLKKMTR